jgi:hypothetical protein
MNYIFLDVDGVLNNEQFLLKHLDDDVILDESNIKLLGELVSKAQAKVILSSSWRLLFTEKGNPRRSVWQTRRGFELAKTLKKYGVRISGRTEVARNKFGDYYDAGNRPKEIFNYIMHNLTAGDRFVILDDEDFRRSMLRFANNFVLVDWKYGLQEKDIEKALNILL